MSSIKKYGKIIKSIPVEKHSVIVRKENWIKNESLVKRLKNNNKEKSKQLLILLNEIFSISETKTIEISRENILTEENLEKKFIKVLLWGYPTGGRGTNIADILYSRNELIPRISDFIENHEKMINSKDFKNLFYTQNKNGKKGKKIMQVSFITLK